MEGMIEVNCDVCGSEDSIELLALLGSAYHECKQCGLIYAKWIADNYEDINDQAFAAEIEDYAAKVDIKKKRYQKKLVPDPSQAPYTFIYTEKCAHTMRPCGSSAR